MIEAFPVGDLAADRARRRMRADQGQGQVVAFAKKEADLGAASIDLGQAAHQIGDRFIGRTDRGLRLCVRHR